jgi:hypothetical protein
VTSAWTAKATPAATSEPSPTDRLTEYLAARGLTPQECPNLKAFDPVSPPRGLKHRGTGFEIKYPLLHAPGSYVPGLSRVRFLGTPPLDREGEVIRYSQAEGSGSHLFIPPSMVEPVRFGLLCGGASARLLVVEGEVKSMKAAKHAEPGILVVGIQGITAWSSRHRMLPLLARLMVGREVLLAPDGDATTNPGVKAGLGQLIDATRRAGATSTTVLRWDGAAEALQ